jgi:hypothetical protein
MSNALHYIYTTYEQRLPEVYNKQYKSQAKNAVEGGLDWKY